ncbi:head-tail joining protein [Shewanella sp. ZOR0012]|jgi:hypothetical protein|uniref:head-tail joining protein n=1 Tax=Shewanella sp. ZOR0012 TaxID=1339231 RepID=UPI000648410A
MRDPFKRASRRIVRRLGKPVVITTANGVRIDNIKGVYSAPEEDALVKGRKGGLALKTRSATLTVCDDDIDCRQLSTDWRIIVPHVNREFFPAEHLNDGDGCTVIYLADALTPSPDMDEQGNESKWR